MGLMNHCWELLGHSLSSCSVLSSYVRWKLDCRFEVTVCETTIKFPSFISGLCLLTLNVSLGWSLSQEATSETVLGLLFEEWIKDFSQSAFAYFSELHVELWLIMEISAEDKCWWQFSFTVKPVNLLKHTLLFGFPTLTMKHPLFHQWYRMVY